MCAYVIGVVRSAQRLDVLVYEALDPVDRQRPWRREAVCELRPLAVESVPELWAAWHALAAVERWDAATLAHVQTVLRETVPAPADDGDLSVLPDLEPQAPPRATAANPRAYRGTKHRPPRSRKPAPIDLRPYLLARRHVDQIAVLLDTKLDPIDATASFERCLLATLVRDGDVDAFVVLARTLELHGSPELRAALVGLYLAAGDPARALAWWSHVLAHDAEHRLQAAQLASATGVAKIDPPEPSFATVIASSDPIAQWSLYRGLAKGASPAYLTAGLELGAIACAQIEDLPAGQGDVGCLIDATIDRLATAMESDSGPAFWRSHLWRLCGEQPELVELLPQLEPLNPAAAFQFIRLAASPRWTPATAAKEWFVLASKLPMLIDVASQTELAYQPKLVDELSDVFWQAVVEYESISDADMLRNEVTDALAKCVDLICGLLRPPFGTDAVLGHLLPYLSLEWTDRFALRNAPDASWLALEAECKRDNQARLVGRGFVRLGRLAPKLLVAAFAKHPGALIETADSLSAVSVETCEKLITAFNATPLADRALEQAELARLCEVVEPIARVGGPNPVRQALRRYLDGEVTLSDAQLAGHRTRVVDDLDLVRLAAIRQSVERTLAARVGIERIETEPVRHALAMLGCVDVHRRQLKRMLTATLAGDRDWKHRHPKTQAWWSRHLRIDRKRWLAGITTTGKLPEVGPVRIAIEHDPLEALKLGTYVGSCLGRGGRLEYSSAAVVLDANKHVVYARDARNAVIGRQLVALTEADQLVCFEVYGNAKAEPLFREWDAAFAADVGIKIVGDHDYEIASILSLEWWDDGAWLA